jgi:hypothetical protein
MSITTGALSYLRFVAAAVPDGFEEPYCDMLEQRQFRPIDPRSEVEEAVGWVSSVSDPFAAEFDPGSLVSSGGLIRLCMRVDTLKVPAALLRATVAKEARLAGARAGRDKLNKREVDALRLEVKKTLRLQSLPRMVLVEAVWDVSTGKVRLFTTSRSLAALFVDHFEKTLAQALQPVGLVSILWLLGVDESERDRLSTLEPERFHLSPT